MCSCKYASSINFEFTQSSTLPVARHCDNNNYGDERNLVTSHRAYLRVVEVISQTIDGTLQYVPSFMPGQGLTL